MKIQKPFHEGELEVQDRLGLRTEGKQNSGVITDSIVKGALRFIEQQSMAVLGSVDRDENVWASVLAGQAGFMQATTERLITFDLSKTAGNEHDPFWKNIEDHPQVGILVIELATRRRLRINGRIRRSGEQRLELEVLESYPNCPKYIQRRHVTTNRVGARATTLQVHQGNALGAAQQAIIKKADTLFVASAHPERGVDASHRGGNPGFARIVDDFTLRIPDYTGNCLFNTLGNFVESSCGPCLYRLRAWHHPATHWPRGDPVGPGRPPFRDWGRNRRHQALLGITHRPLVTDRKGPCTGMVVPGLFAVQPATESRCDALSK